VPARRSAAAEGAASDKTPGRCGIRGALSPVYFCLYRRVDGDGRGSDSKPILARRRIGGGGEGRRAGIGGEIAEQTIIGIATSLTTACGAAWRQQQRGPLLLPAVSVFSRRLAPRGAAGAWATSDFWRC